MSSKQITTVLLSMALTLLAVGGTTVLMVHQIKATQVEMLKAQGRILDSVEALNKQVDWTGHGE